MPSPPPHLLLEMLLCLHFMMLPPRLIRIVPHPHHFQIHNLTLRHTHFEIALHFQSIAWFLQQKIHFFRYFYCYCLIPPFVPDFKPFLLNFQRLMPFFKVSFQLWLLIFRCYCTHPSSILLIVQDLLRYHRGH